MRPSWQHSEHLLSKVIRLVGLEEHGCGSYEALQMRPINPFDDGVDALSIAVASDAKLLLLSQSEMMEESIDSITTATAATIDSECYC